VKKTTLVLPFEDPRAKAFKDLANKTGRKLAFLEVLYPSDEAMDAAELPRDASADAEKAPEAWTRISWKPQSFVSARTALIETETRLGQALDELVIFADPPAGPIGLAEASQAEIEQSVLDWAVAYAQLIHEALKRFLNRDGCSIVLAIKDAARGPLGSMAAGALFGLAEGLLASFASSEMLSGGAAVAKAKSPPEKTVPFRFMAMRDESDSSEAVARQVLRMLDEDLRDSGKLQRFTGRSGFFSR